MMINSTTRLEKNKRKTYKWSGISLLDQLRCNKKNSWTVGRALVCTEKVTNMQISYFLVYN